MLRFLATVLDNATVLHDELISLRQQSQASSSENDAENECAEEVAGGRQVRNRVASAEDGSENVHRELHHSDASAASLEELTISGTSARRISEVVAILVP